MAASTAGAAAIVVSFSLMVAMAIMVYSFRESFLEWLSRTLPAPVQWRVAPGSDTAVVDTDFYSTLAAAPDVFVYTDRPLYLPGQKVFMKGIVREVEAGVYRLETKVRKTARNPKLFPTFTLPSFVELGDTE